MFLHRWIRKLVLNNKGFKDSFIINFVYLFYGFVKYYISSGFKYYKIDKFSSLKSSNTLVIFGAGSTVNELTKLQCDELDNYDIAGLSYSCVLPVEQNYYFYESPSAHELAEMQEHIDKVIPVVKKGMREGRLKCLIWKNSENKILNKYADLKFFLCPKVCSILTDNPDVIKTIIKYYIKWGLNKYFLIQSRGSVSALVQFALLLQYKRIIFVGIDLNSGGYFFETTNEYDSYGFADPYSFDELYDRNKNLHPTNDPSLGIPIIEVLKVMVKESKDTKFYVSSENSALISFLPLWEWQNKCECRG